MPSNDYVSDAEDRKVKRTILAPCVYKAKNDLTNKIQDFYPAVNCDYRCDCCGWNPEVAKARVERMTREYAEGRKAK